MNVHTRFGSKNLRCGAMLKAPSATTTYGRAGHHQLASSGASSLRAPHSEVQSIQRWLVIVPELFDIPSLGSCWPVSISCSYEGSTQRRPTASPFYSRVSIDDP